MSKTGKGNVLLLNTNVLTLAILENFCPNVFYRYFLYFSYLVSALFDS